MWVDAYQPVIANGVVSSDPLDIEPGVSIDITKNINLNPYLNIYPGAKNLIDATSINMIVTAKLL